MTIANIDQRQFSVDPEHTIQAHLAIAPLAPAASALARANASIRPEQDAYVATHGEMLLRSVFQPIVSLSHLRTVGYEALLRVAPLKSGEAAHAIPPLQFLNSPREDRESIFIDRLCRALHARNFVAQGDRENWLFLNVSPLTVVMGRGQGTFFRELIESLQLPPERVVIEVLEHALVNEDEIERAVHFYRDLGCLVAIDDFGAGHSNFRRVWQLKPDIIKLDRSMIAHASRGGPMRRMLPGIVSLLHEAGSLVLVEGVENEEEAMLAMEANADLMQGWYCARPGPRLGEDDTLSQRIGQLHRRCTDAFIARNQSDHHLTPYIAQMRQASQALTQAEATHPCAHDALNCLLTLPFADRCFILDDEARQIGPSRTAPDVTNGRAGKFKPLEHAQGSSWVRRPYFHRAMEHPGVVQITRPYLSFATGKLCITLSVTFTHAGKPHVLCLDVFFEEAWS